VIDVGCGTGITTRAFVNEGIDVVAIEPSRALLERARSAAPTATFIRASAYDVELVACEGIVAVGEPLTYHAPEVDADAVLASFFEKAARAIAPNGMFIFDLICTGPESLDATGWRSEDDWTILHQTVEYRAAHRLERTIETFTRTGDLFRRSRETHHVHVFEEACVRAWLERAGFDVETSSTYGEAPLRLRRRAFFASRRPT
jgi:SAM-dependent methyltransferase